MEPALEITRADSHPVGGLGVVQAENVTQDDGHSIPRRQIDQATVEGSYELTRLDLRPANPGSGWEVSQAG